MVWLFASSQSVLNIVLQGIMFGAMQAGDVFAVVPNISPAKGAPNAIMELLDSTPLVDTESTGRKPVPGEVV